MLGIAEMPTADFRALGSQPMVFLAAATATMDADRKGEGTKQPHAFNLTEHKAYACGFTSADNQQRVICCATDVD